MRHGHNREDARRHHLRSILVQDLINTIDIEAGHDTLRTTTALSTFCRDHGLGTLRFSADDLASVRLLREALRDACAAHAGRSMPPPSSATLRQHLDRARLIMSIDVNGEAHLAPEPSLRGVDAFVAHIAMAISAAVGDGTWHRLKACEADECRWVYYDHGPAGSSRWCTMSICGSRNKMRSYRARSDPHRRHRQKPPLDEGAT